MSRAWTGRIAEPSIGLRATLWPRRQGGLQTAEAEKEIDLSALAGSFLVPGGELVLRGRAEGCKPSELRLVPAQVQTGSDETRHELHADLALQPIASVRGRVVDHSGEPVHKALVLLTTSAKSFGSGDVVGSAVTGTDGRFELQSEGGALWLQAVHRRHGVAKAFPVAFEEGKPANVGDVELRGASISGRVHGIPPHVPPAGLEITLRYPASLVRSSGNAPFSLGPESLVSHEGTFEPAVGAPSPMSWATSASMACWITHITCSATAPGGRAGSPGARSPGRRSSRARKA